MRRIYRKIRSRYGSSSYINRVTNEIAKQSLGYQILQPLMIEYPYLPFNGGALRPFNISFLLNDIIINDRKIIVEFGSGISTILISRLIKRNKLSCQLISIESDLDWNKKLNRILEGEDVHHNTTIINAPLKEIETPFGINNWYDFDDSIFLEKKIDLVIVDGPPAYLEELKHSRYPALPKVHKFLSKNHMIYLDDTNRIGEKEVILRWEKDFDIKFNKDGSNYSTYISHESFGTIPFQIK